MIDLQHKASYLNALFEMKDSVQDLFIQHPRIGFCSDGAFLLHHPRSFGSFARIIDHYVYQRKVLTLQEAIYKATGLNADTYKIKDRGYIREGYYADILVFRPERITQRAHFANPTEMSEGFDVIVNGNVALMNGKQKCKCGRIVESYAERVD
ncbi:hypothetical protein GEMRC1_002182 [Eukaryota sp. GEM-RC1]